MTSLATYNQSIAGEEVVVDDHFVGVTFSATDNTNQWFATLNTGSIALADDGVNGLLVLTTHTDDNDVVNVQRPGEAFKLQANKEIVCSFVNVKVNDADQTVFFVGLSITDTAILNATGTGEGAVTDAIGFLWDGSGLYAVASKNGTTTWQQKIDTGVTLSDDTFVEEMAFAFDGKGTVIFYVDHVEVARITDTATTKTGYPDDEALTPSMEVQNIDGSANTFTIDRFKIRQKA